MTIHPRTVIGVLSDAEVPPGMIAKIGFFFFHDFLFTDTMPDVMNMIWKRSLCGMYLIMP